jgi:diguanylate cyclase (GGDEF)-like protein/PAS domain S-box-containing protein
MPQIAGDLVVSPLSLANDVIGAVFASLALTYGWVWYRDRDPGIHWFAVSWALGGLWFFASSFHAPAGSTIEWSAWQLVIVAAAAFATVGLTDYLEIPAPQRRRSALLALAPLAAMLGLSLVAGITHALIPRWVNNLPVAAWYTAMGALIWKAGRQEHGAEHNFVAAVFFLCPPVFIARAAAGYSLSSMRHFAALPFVMFALSLLTSTLLRRRRTLEAQVALRRAAEERYRAIAEWTPEAVAVHRNGVVLYANPALAQMFGAVAPQELIGRPVLDLVHPDHHDAVGRSIRRNLSIGKRVPAMRQQCVKLDGTVIDVDATAIDILYDGSPAAYVLVRDVTEQLKSEARIQRLAFYDDLTGLPNRRLFLERLGEALRLARRGGEYGLLMYLDLDNFKDLNDARGHALGDRLLIEVARRVGDVLRPEDTFARLGGDEFVVIVGGLGPELAMAEITALGIAENVRAALAGSYDIEGGRYSASASIGLTLFPIRQEGADALLREADTAMYRAKTGGRNRIAYFEPGMQTEAEERFALALDLKEALDAGQIDILVQPQFERGRVETGGELLLRWRHPQRGRVAPDQFIPVAEESGLILGLGEFVLRRACESLARLEAAGCAVPLSVNISPVQFHQENFVARMKALLHETGAPASRLVFEVTEGLFIDNWQRVAARMSELAAMGIRFSIDDFGTGYSSLAYLKKLPLQEIKIDQQFVQNTPLDANDRAIVVSIIAVAKSFRLRIVAEGVETQAQADILAAEGCDCYQGFHFAAPLPLAEWLEARERLHGAAPQRKLALG